MTLSHRVAERSRANVGGLYVQTTEADAATVELAQMCRREGWRFVTWDFCRGLGSNGFEIDSLLAPTIGDPVAALMAVPKLGSQPGTTLLALRGFHRFLARPDVALTLERQLTVARGLRLVLIILAPVVSLPGELERQFVVIEHGLPARAELFQILCRVTAESERTPWGAGLESVLNAASGITRRDAEMAFRLSMVRDGRVTPNSVSSIRVEMLTSASVTKSVPELPQCLQQNSLD